MEADAPDDAGDVVLREVEFGQLDFRNPNGRVVRFLRGIDACFRDVVVDALADAVVGSIGAVEFVGEVLADGEFLEIDVLDEAVEFHALAREFPQVDLVAAVASG